MKTEEGQTLTREHAYSDICRALQVLVLDRRTRAYLIEHDPKALQQACRALHDLGLQYQPRREEGESSDLCWYCLSPQLDAEGSCRECKGTSHGTWRGPLTHTSREE